MQCRFVIELHPTASCDIFASVQLQQFRVHDQDVTTQRPHWQRGRSTASLILVALVAGVLMWMDWAIKKPHSNNAFALLPQALAQEEAQQLDLYYDLNCGMFIGSITDVREVFLTTAIAYRGNRGTGEMSMYGNKQDPSCINLYALRADVEDTVGLLERLRKAEDDLDTAGVFGGASSLVKDAAANMMKHPACAKIALRGAEIQAEINAPFPLSLMNGSKAKLEEELADLQRQYQVCSVTRAALCRFFLEFGSTSSG